MLHRILHNGMDLQFSFVQHFACCPKFGPYGDVFATRRLGMVMPIVREKLDAMDVVRRHSTCRTKKIAVLRLTQGLVRPSQP